MNEEPQVLSRYAPHGTVTLTREQLQAERDAWYENGLRNGEIRLAESLRVARVE